MQEILAKAKNIKLLLLDVDGILTNGIIYYDHQGNHTKGFHVHDGMGIKLLHKQGIEVGIISAKHSEAVNLRAKELGLQHIYLGHEAKLPIYETIKQQTNLSNDEIAYMGDDLPDLPLLKKVGLAITVPNSCKTIQQHVDHITQRHGGNGAVREICELILMAKESLNDSIKPFLSEATR